MKKLLLSAIFITQSLLILAQDIHFTQFMYSPMNVSPSLTGLFKGDYRFIANYRSQWGSVTTPYSTFAFSADMLMGNGLGDMDIIGGGLVFSSDKAGDTDFSTNQLGLSFAYHKSLSYYGNHYLSLGVQAGLGQRRVDPSKMTFDNQFDGQGFDPNTPPNEYIEVSSYIYPDISIGLSWYLAPSEHSNIYFGGALHHVNEPNQSFFINGVEPLHVRNVIYGGGKIPLGNKISLLPSAVYMSQGTLNQAMVGGYLRYLFNARSLEEETAFSVGLFNRVNDALSIAMRLEHKNFNFGFSYDVNMSKLTTASSGSGGPELSLSYIVSKPNSNKTKRNKPVFCPKF